MTSTTVEAYWRHFLATLPHASPLHGEAYVAEAFGDTPDLANRLAALVVTGTKTATCSALWEWEASGTPVTPVGQKTIVLDGNDQPVCIIETVEVTIRSYQRVDAGFATAEGEGDRSLDDWRTAHWNFFGRTLPRIGKQPTLDMPLVCERFRVIYTENG